MPEYYLDIETTGLDPTRDRIVTIQYQRIDLATGRAEGPLTVLKEWESTEEGILELFIPIFLGSGPFSFVAVGMNIPFIYTFLVERAKAAGIDAPDPVYLIGRKPFLDLKPFLVMMNDGSFRGASLDRFTNISFTGEAIPDLYARGDHEAIIRCIEEEAREFQALYRRLKERSSALLAREA